MALPKLYNDLAAWWPVFSPPAHYLEEATFFMQALRQTGRPLRTLLELGSGAGSNAFHMKAAFASTLVDLSPRMLEVSRAINPECEHLVGDMRTVRLGRVFDVVFIHDAIEYMTSEDDLRAALLTAHAHCAPGGVALFVPDYVRESYVAETSHGGLDGTDRALRYLEWTYDPDPSDCTYRAHFAFLLRDAAGQMHVDHDEHTFGLFPRATWIALLRAVGFQPSIVVDSYQRDVFIALR